jgi:hypothetical protein
VPKWAERLDVASRGLALALPLVARNGPNRLVWRRPLIWADRKWLIDGQNDAIGRVEV